MQDTLLELENLKKKESKIGQQDAKDAANLIMNIYKDTKDISLLVNTLVDFHYSVSKCFFTKFYSLFNEEDTLQAVVNELIKIQKSKKSNSTRIINNAFSMIGIYVNQNSKLPSVTKIFNYLLFLTEKENGFSKQTLEKFNRQVISCCKNDFLNIDIAMLKDIERKRIYRFIIALSDAQMLSLEDKQVVEWIEKNGFTLPKTVPIKMVPISDGIQEVLKNDSKKKDIVSEPQKANESKKENKKENNKENKPSDTEINLMNTLTKAQNVAESISKVLNEDLGTINQLKSQINAKDKELTILTDNLKKQGEKILNLNSLITKKERMLQEDSTKIQDLTERLKSSLQMDSVSNNQKLITLKKDIANNLQLEYEDFQESLSSKYSEDEFEANRATLSRIFRTLKRLSIEFE